MVSRTALPREMYSPSNGMRITVEETAADTGGAYVTGELRLPPSADGPPMHWHPTATETFTVREGTLLVETLAGTETLRPGESLTVVPGMPHRFDAGPDGCVFLGRVEPPSGVHEFLVSQCAIAQAGYLDERTPQALLRVAVWLDEHREFTRSMGVADRLFPLLARLGRAIGYPTTYEYAPTGDEVDAGADAGTTGKPSL